jgi:hypothetical protein
VRDFCSRQGPCRCRCMTSDIIAAMLFEQSSAYGAQGMQAQQRLAGAQAMQKLHAACQQGGLPQQLHSFGVAYCAAFPQPGCCGNPACTNLDKFTETALASQGCLGCNRVSPSVLLAVWSCWVGLHRNAPSSPSLHQSIAAVWCRTVLHMHCNACTTKLATLHTSAAGMALC